MPKGRTGIEIIKSLFTKPPIIEKQFYNPLDAKIGTHARLNNVLATIRGEQDVDLSSDLFTLTEIWAWTRNRHGTKLPPMADYVLESDMKKLILRVVTEPKPKPEIHFILLTQHWPESDQPYPWGEESLPILEYGCMDQKGQLTRHAGTDQEEIYFRDLCNAQCEVSIISDTNGDGKAEIGEVISVPHSLWTFRRETKDNYGQDYTQHLHVQLSGLYKEATKTVSGGDKTILMLAGQMIPAANLFLY